MLSKRDILGFVAGETTGLEEALSRVVRLAGDHIGALDSTLRHMAAHAWVGGGATPFTQATQDQRTRLQRAFETAAAQIVERIRAQGGNATAPSLATALPVSTSTRGGFSGMDVGVMTRMVADLERAGHDLPAVGSRLSAALGSVCVSPVPAQQVAAVGTWATGQAADLRRRLTVLQQRPDGAMANAALLGFGLFGGFAPDPDGVGGLLAAAANGDTAALKKVVEAQNTGKDPTLAARVHAWWQMLDPAARQRLIDAEPRLVGSLNGVPAATRDSANRAYLGMRKSVIDKQLAELREMTENMKGGAWQSRLLFDLDALEEELRKIAAIEKSLALGGIEGRPPALLLQVDVAGLGKAAISFGDPDKADSVVTSVPGTGSTLEGIGGDAKRAAVLWDQSSSSSPDTKVASIVWLCYKAPQLDASVLWADSSVASPKLAEDGAGPLAGFLDGLHATHQPTGTPRFTVLGHSYGSVVTGIAAQSRKGTFADQLILLGSPGTMAAKASDLGVKHVWVGESPQDPIADLGHLGMSGGRHPISGILHPWLPNGEGPFGTDPSNIAFGANRFVVDPTPAGWTGYSLDAHSSYWARGSSSLLNMGHIITGRYQDVDTLPTPRSRSAQDPVPRSSPTSQSSPTSPGD